MDKKPPQVRVVDDSYANDKRVEELVAKARLMLRYGSLEYVVGIREQVNAIVTEINSLVGYGSVPEDIWEILTIVDDLVAGKVDRIADQVKFAIPKRRDFLKASYQAELKYLDSLEDRLKQFAKDAVRISQRPAISGNRWKARIQRNPHALVVDDLARVPVKYKNKSLTITYKFGASEQNVESYWARVFDTFKGDKAFKAELVEVLNGDAVKAEMTANKDSTIPGVSVEQGTHVRFEPSKATSVDVIPLTMPDPATVEKPLEGVAHEQE